MSGDWIKMRVDLATDPAVIAVAEALGIDEDLVVGKLHKLWSWADAHTTDGSAKNVTVSWMERYMGVTGFCDALIEAGWLVRDNGGIRVPNFDRHMGEGAKRRAVSTERQREYRKTKHNDSVTPKTRQCHKSVTRKALPEKRREEKNKDKDYTLSFLEFWQAWPKHPRKTGKAKCFKKWMQTVSLSRLAHVVAVVEAMKKSREWSDPQYIPAPLVWLNQQRWDCELSDIETTEEPDHAEF